MNQNFMWANLVHLGSNMWNEEGNTTGREHRSTPCASPKLRFFRETWDAHMQELRDSGVNTLIIDVGESLKYESHPELAAEGAFTHDQMKAEIREYRMESHRTPQYIPRSFRFSKVKAPVAGSVRA